MALGSVHLSPAIVSITKPLAISPVETNTNCPEDLTEMIIPALPGADTYGHQYPQTEDQTEILPWVTDKNWRPAK